MRIDLFEETIKKYGSELQLEVVIEECAELIQVLQKFKRMKHGTPNANVTEEDIISEAVDVEIMIEQMKRIFRDQSLWNVIRYKKLERMEKRLGYDKETTS